MTKVLVLESMEGGSPVSVELEPDGCCLFVTGFDTEIFLTSSETKFLLSFLKNNLTPKLENV